MNQQICQRPNSRANICLPSPGERLALLYFGQQTLSLFIPNQNRNWPRIRELSLVCSRGHKQLFWVALPLLRAFIRRHSAQLAESRILYMQGAEPAGGVCHCSTSAHFSFSVGEWRQNRFLLFLDDITKPVRFKKNGRQRLLWAEGQVGVVPLDPHLVSLAVVDPGDPWPCMWPAGKGGKAISSSNKDANWISLDSVQLDHYYKCLGV